MFRKHVLAASADQRDGIDVAAAATVTVTSEAPGHPVEHAFDGRRGRGATRWVAGEAGDQELTLAFDAPQDIRQVTLEVEEDREARAQEVELAASADGGRTFRVLVRQGYNFSPPATTLEREEWAVGAEGVTPLRLRIVPDTGGRPCRATLTTLGLR
jgi:hypothetical protein